MPELQTLQRQAPGVSTQVTTGLPQSIAAVAQPSKRMERARQLLQLVGSVGGMAQQKIAEDVQEKAFEEGQAATQEAVGKLGDLQTTEGIKAWAEKVKSGEVPVGANPYVHKLVNQYAYKQLAQTVSRHLTQWYAQSPLKGADPDIVAVEARKELMRWTDEVGVDPEDPRYIANFNPEVERYFSNDLMRQASSLYVSVNQARLREDTTNLASDAARIAITNLTMAPTDEDNEVIIGSQAARVQERMEAAKASGISPREVMDNTWKGIEAQVRSSAASLLMIQPGKQEDGSTAQETIAATYAAQVELLNTLPKLITTTQRADGTYNTWEESGELQAQRSQLLGYLDNKFDEANARLSSMTASKKNQVVKNTVTDLMGVRNGALAEGLDVATAVDARVEAIYAASDGTIDFDDLMRYRNLVVGTADSAKKALGLAVSEEDFRSIMLSVDDITPSQYLDAIEPILTGSQREKAMAVLDKRDDLVSKAARDSMRRIYDYYGISYAESGDDIFKGLNFGGDPQQVQRALTIKRLIGTSVSALDPFLTYGEGAFSTAGGLDLSIAEANSRVQQVEKAIIQTIDAQLTKYGVLGGEGTAPLPEQAMAETRSALNTRLKQALTRSKQTPEE